MKKITFILLCVLGIGCTPIQKLSQPVDMNYVVHTENNGFILCETILFYKDSVVLHNAGYYKDKMKQKRVSEIIFFNSPSLMVIKVNKKR